MQRKPLAIIGNIAERTFLTGNNWISTTAPAILSGITVDARAGSVTTIMQNSWLNVYGTLNVNAASGGRPAALIACETGGEIIVRGGQVNNNGTINPNCFGACILVQNYGGNTGKWFLGDNNSQTFTGGAFLAMDGGELSLGSAASLNIGMGSRLEVRQASTFTFGSSSSLSTSGNIEVWNNTQFNLSAGSVVYANAGAQFLMSNGASIYTEGKLHAIGTSQSPVVFQGTGGTTWEGIRAKSGNFSGILGDIRIENATFSNATKPIHLETPVAAYIANVTMNSPQIGVEVLPNYNLWVEPPPPPTMQLVAVTISGAYSYGITVENFSDLQLGSCVVSGNQGIAGIALTGSSPKMLESTFSGFDIGIWGVANSSPLLFDQGIGGFNIFTQNNVGAQFEGSSNAALGIDDGTGGQNSFTAYYSYAVALADNSIVNAEWNWYGTPSPTQNLFSITGGSKLYWEPYLTSPPGGNAPMARGVGQKEGDDPRLTLTDPRMKQVLRLRVQSRNTEASALLVAIVADGGATMQIKRWALGQLLAVSQMLRAPNLAAYLNALRTTMPQVRQYLAELMPGAFMHERSVRNALDWYNDNIRNHSNSITEAQALYGKFTYALYGEGNRTEAEALVTTLQSRYPRSGQTKLANAQMTATLQSASPGNGPVAKGSASTLYSSSRAIGAKPATFGLEQNYPNPFNPTTNIRFSIRDAGLTSLRVYDVLGREVATPVNEQRQAGGHEIKFDATGLPSGVYIYKLTAGNFSASKKLLLMK